MKRFYKSQCLALFNISIVIQAERICLGHVPLDVGLEHPERRTEVLPKHPLPLRFPVLSDQTGDTSIVPKPFVQLMYQPKRRFVENTHLDSMDLDVTLSYSGLAHQESRCSFGAISGKDGS